MKFGESPSQVNEVKSIRQLRLEKVPVEDLLKIMRPDSMGPVIGKLPDNFDEQYDYIVEQLKKCGLYREGLKQRIISAEFKQKAITTGNDRGYGSGVKHNGGVDGEVLAMKEQDVDISDTTYVSDFSKGSCRVYKGAVILIYYGEALAPLQPSSNQSNTYSNGFSMFIHPRLKQKSLVAVFEN